MGCQPEGAACNNYLIQYSLALVLKESLKIYCAINDGIINLVDMFFDMSKHDAVKTLDIYIRAGQQADYLAEFYEFCKWLDLAQNFQFPTLRQPPPSFLATMEEYVREAPQIGSVLHRPGSGKTDEASDDERETPEEILKTEPEPQLELPPLISTDDLLGLGEVNPMPPEVEEKSNLAIIQPGGVNQSSTSNALMELGTSGWELPLVSTSTNNNTIPPQVQGGSFDKLFFDSLYEDENARRQLQMQNVGYGQFEMEEGAMVMQANNPFEQQQDPFFMFNGTDNVQMAHHHQQQQQTMMHQQQQSPPLVMQENQMQSMMMVPYESPPQHIQFPEARQQPMDMGIGVGMGMGVGSSNPFEDPFSVCPQKTNQHGNSGLM